MNRIFQTKVNLYKDIIQNYLISNGISYVVGQDDYYYDVDDIPYHLSVKDEVITIDCRGANKTEHYVFPVNRPDILLEHYCFSSKSADSTEITHTRLTGQEDELFITASGVTLDATQEIDSCASKIVFFSREALGNGLYDTLNRIRFIDNSIPTGTIQDIPRKTTETQALTDMQNHEKEIRRDLRQKHTR